jgi:hypothetical protein
VEFDLKAWIDGGCAICGKPERGGKSTAHVECWQGEAHNEAMIEQIKFALRCSVKAINYLNDHGLAEDRAMTAARREQRRELVRDIKAAVKPENAK